MYTSFTTQLLVVIYSLFLCFSIPLSAQSTIQFVGAPAAKAHIQQVIKEAYVPGISLSVIEQGELAFMEGFGTKSLDTGGAVDPYTIFAAASLSKPVFAYAVMQLVDAGQLDLDRPLYQYLPYPDAAEDERYQQITARMLLSHSGGFPNWRRSRALSILFDPGTAFQYSGEGYVYLMKVVEKITGKDLNTFMQERVFTPLGMQRSSYVWEERFEDNYAIPHTKLYKTAGHRKPSKSNTAYSLQTCLHDFTLFMQALLEGKHLKPSTHQLMLRPQVEVETNELGTVSWGLGVGLQETDAGVSLWQWGDNGTFRCYMLAYPASKTALVYFTNSAMGQSICGSLLEGLLGGTYPAVVWNNYYTYKAPIFKATRGILDHGIQKGMADFMHPSGEHQDTSIIEEQTMNRIGYQLLNLDKRAEALQIFQWNLKAYPNSPNAYDSYAEALLMDGQQQEAAAYYAKSIAMGSDNPTAVTISENLKSRYAVGNTTFELNSYQLASSVFLAGSFNDWNTLSHPCIFKNGKWICRVQLEPGTYEYKFLVNGVWIPDPDNPERKAERPYNSILVVE
ncbi:MAG: serine hydrolase [Bacteroidota bacterium]